MTAIRKLSSRELSLLGLLFCVALVFGGLRLHGLYAERTAEMSILRNAVLAATQTGAREPVSEVSPWFAEGAADVAAVQLRRLVEERAKSVGLAIRAIRAEPRDDGSALTATANLSGPFAQIVSFVDGLARHAPPLLITELRIETGEEEESVAATLSLAAYLPPKGVQ